jgi:integrase
LGRDRRHAHREFRILAAAAVSPANAVEPAAAAAPNNAAPAPVPAPMPAKILPSTALAAAAPVPLRQVFKSYAKEAKLSHGTVKRWSPVIERLIARLGHDDAAAITPADLVAWKDDLLEEGMSNITVRDVYIAATKATLQFAVDQRQLPANPAKDVRVRVPKKVKEREKGFDGKEAATILAATLRPFSHLISKEMKAARRWVPWICAYTGARVNEITPVTGASFAKRDGIWVIRIRGADAKTRSYREVPLHGHLIEMGLLAYAKSCGAKPLFYDPGRSRGGKDSNPHHKKVAERLAEWVRSLGIDGDVAPNHGWRHRFSSVSRLVGMTEEVRNIIQGHAAARTAGDYGESESFAKGGGAHLRAGCLIGRPDPIGAARSHVNSRTALRAKYAQILAELFSVGGAVALTGRDVTFPIEHDQVAIVRSGDGIRSPRNQFAGARGRRAVQSHFRSEPMNEWLQFGEGECPQSRLRHLSGIGLAARGRVRRELLAEQVRPFSRLPPFVASSLVASSSISLCRMTPRRRLPSIAAGVSSAPRPDARARRQGVIRRGQGGRRRHTSQPTDPPAPTGERRHPG